MLHSLSSNVGSAAVEHSPCMNRQPSLMLTVCRCAEMVIAEPANAASSNDAGIFILVLVYFGLCFGLYRFRCANIAKSGVKS